MRYKLNLDVLEDLSFDGAKDLMREITTLPLSYHYIDPYSRTLILNYETANGYGAYECDFRSDCIELSDGGVERQGSAAFQKAIELGIYTPIEP